MKIVLLHGWGCDSRIWQSLLSFLECYGEIESVDLNYHIENALAHDNYAVGLAVDLVVDSIAVQLSEPSILCGWSLGGMLATQLAARYPQKVAALITLSSNAVYVANKGWPEAMPTATFEQFFLQFKKNPKKTLKRFMLLEIHGDEHAKGQLQYLQTLTNCVDEDGAKPEILAAGLQLLATIDNADLIDKIKCHSLYIFGQNDALVPAGAAEAIKAKVCENQAVIVIKDRGHLLHYPKEKLLTILEPFFLTLSDGMQEKIKSMPE